MSKQKYWCLVNHGLNAGSLNMAFDEALLKQAVVKKLTPPVLRLYGFGKKTLTVGYAQKTQAAGHLKQYHKAGYDLVRRLTGGGLVVHGEDLTYAVIANHDYLPEFRSIEESYLTIHRAIQAGFAEEGIAVELFGERKRGGEPHSDCFTAPVAHDLIWRKKKIAGAAQKRLHGYFLHQGSVSLEPLLARRLGFTQAFQTMKQYLLKGFRKVFQAEFVDIDFSLKEMQEIYLLEKEKYARAEWNLKL